MLISSAKISYRNINLILQKESQTGPWFSSWFGTDSPSQTQHSHWPLWEELAFSQMQPGEILRISCGCCEKWYLAARCQGLFCPLVFHLKFGSLFPPAWRQMVGCCECCIPQILESPAINQEKWAGRKAAKCSTVPELCQNQSCAQSV